MATPTLRNPNLVQALAWRESMRQDLPAGTAGMVIEDLDLVLRWFGSNYNLDAIGRLRLVEMKHITSGIGRAQESTFGLIDMLCRAGNPERYDGFFVVQADMNAVDEVELPNGRVVEIWSDDIEIRVCGERAENMTKAEFMAWCDNPYSPIPPMQLNLPRRR
jgi:hypothetical protein